MRGRFRRDQPPSIAFLRSACAGLSPSQILVSARLNASPGMVPLAAPLKPTTVRAVDEIERDDVAFLHLAEGLHDRRELVAAAP